MKFSGALAAILFVAVAVSSVQAQVDGTIRLVNGTTYAGRVEIYSAAAGLWYSVCADSSLCTNAAKVACAQLGYSRVGAQVYGYARYGEGNGTVGFQNVQCTGNETNVTQCTYTTPSTCPHSMDAAVSCYPSSICRDIGGHSGCCSGGGCGITIGGSTCYCDYTCRFFGDCCANIGYTCPSFGSPPGLPGSTYCSTVGAVSFVNGAGSAGRLRICDSDNLWKSVCSSGFDAVEARVVCRSFGLSETNFTIYNASQFGQSTLNILARNLSCTGAQTEVDLTYCSGDQVCCGHQHDVGLACQPACTDGQARMVGGPNMYEGRVEVCHNGRWGTVCDDFWDVYDARVACKQAGLPWRGTVAYSGPTTAGTYGSGIGPIWLDNMRCIGSETSLFDCPSNAVGSHNCVHFEDAGAKCAPGPCELAGFTDRCCDPAVDGNCQGVSNTTVCHCSLDCEDHNDCCIDVPLICRCTDYELRLRGGTVPNEGRIEMCYNGEWGTVCDDFWGTPDAQVVCRQLGYATTGAQAFSYSFFGRGTGAIWLDNVHCTGTETHLVNCSANAIGSHNCGHYEDAGVRCKIPGPTECIHGQARLVRGPSEREGQLEVCYNGVWGTVCDDFWSQVDANVACRNIFPNDPSGGAVTIYYSYLYFGRSTNDILMDNVHCSGSESHLVNCTHSSTHNCYYWEDVGLSCNVPAEYIGEVQLVPGPDRGQLRVYAGSNPTWGPVCYTGFDVEDARVVCRELGQPTASPRVYRNLQFGRGLTSVKYSYVDCDGTETHLNNCTKQTSGFYCSTYWAVGVGCEEACSSGQIRLVDGVNSTEGRVEICRDGAWGTICDPPGARTFATEEASVVCRQLGLPFSAAQVEYFGPGADPYHYASVNCEGGEATLSGCSWDSTPTCTSHYYDVGVTCQDACLPGEVRLVEGGSENQGRVEFCLGGLWGTVCDNQFHNVDAQVICRQLGLPYEGAEATYDARFGQGSDHVAITSLSCTGTEARLLDCIFNTGSDVNCGHANDAGAICQDVCQNGALRLIGGNAPNTGRIETCYHAEWGTICDNGWDYPDVQVACYQLGYTRTPVRAFGGTKYGAGNGAIIFRDMACTGSENSLTQCIANTDTSDCTHSEDAGMECAGSIRPITATATPTSTPTIPPPGIITNVTFTIVNSTYANATWSPPATTNGIIIAYIASYAGMTMNIPGNQPRELYMTTLAPGVPYTLTIVATNVHGGGPVWTKSFFTAQLAPNTPVPIERAIRQNEYTISVTWTPLTLTQARGMVTGYTIYWFSYVEGTVPSPNSVTVGANQTSWTSPNPLSPSSQYSVSVAALTRVGSGPGTNPAIIIPTTSSAYFQLKLALPSGQACGIWTTIDTSTKQMNIVDAVVLEINKRCPTCSFTRDHIANQRFQCNNDLTANEYDQATFRAQLFSPGSFSNTTILRYISDWLNPSTGSASSPTVNIGGVDFNVDSSCQLSISTLDDRLCTTDRPTTAAGSAIGSSVGIGVGLAIGAIVVFAIMAVVLVFIVVFVRRTRIKYQAGDSNDVVGYSNRMAFPEGAESDNISQHMGSTVHDDDFQEALNMISDDVDEKAKMAKEEGQVYMNVK